MSEPPDDDARTDRLLSGSGKDVDPEVAEFLDLVRSTHRAEPVASPALERFVTAPTAPALRTKVWTRLRRTSVVARSTAVAVTAFVATGSLAMAHALPAPAQDFASHLGVGRPATHSRHDAPHPAPTTGPSGGAIPPGTESRSTTGSTPTTGAGVDPGTGGDATDATSPTAGGPPTVTTLRPGIPSADAGPTTLVPTTTTVPGHTNNGVGTGVGKGVGKDAGKGNSGGVPNGNPNGAANPNAHGTNPNANGAANANPNAGANGKAKGH